MHVCIDGTPMDTGHRYRGIGRYVQGLLGGFRRLSVPFPITLLRLSGSDAPAPAGEHVGTVHLWRPLRSRTRFQWAFNEVLLPREVRRTRCALFHATDPRGIVTGCGYRTIATAYDLAHLRFPNEYYAPAPRDEQWAMCRMLSRYRRADHLIAISEATKREFVELLGCDPARVSVTHLACDLERFHPAPVSALCDLRVPERFFLYTGAIDPRKNVRGMLEAYARVREHVPEHFVLTGKIVSADAGRLEAWVRELGLEDRVHQVGFTDDAVLGTLYLNATALAFPSRYEGFGIPVLEAMGCGCPVITSSVSCLPEVVGDAAIEVHPDDIEALAEALRSVSQNASLRESLKAKGRERAAEFSWERCARETLAVYEAVAAGS